MTQLGSVASTSSGGVRLTLWYRLLGSVGSATPAIVATFSEIMNTHTVFISTYSGCDQASPLNTEPAAVIDYDTVNLSNAQITVPTAVGETVVCLAAFNGSTVAATTGTPRAAIN